MFEFGNVRYRDILDIPSLTIARGGVTTLVGGSGSGKTTLLRLLNKLASPDEGEILYDGRPLSGLDTIAHRREVTMLSQTPVVFEGDVRANLTAGLRFRGLPAPDDARLLDVLASVDLRKSLDGPAGTLSGGEKQRLALARVLLLESPVYLMDEPSAALDEDTESRIVSMVVDHVRRTDRTLVMVTHSRAVAREHSDAILTLADGRCTTEVGA